MCYVRAAAVLVLLFVVGHRATYCIIRSTMTSGLKSVVLVVVPDYDTTINNSLSATFFV